MKGRKSWRGEIHGARSDIVAWEKNHYCVSDRPTVGDELGVDVDVGGQPAGSGRRMNRALDGSWSSGAVVAAVEGHCEAPLYCGGRRRVSARSAKR